MANRRMFSLDVVDTDFFLDMPLTAQTLYFHLGMRADDDGFIGNPKRIQRMIGCNDDDLRLLLAKGFIIPFESGACVIRHWKVHNYIRTDRYKETVYTSEKNMLSVAKNGEYALSDTIGIPNVNQTTHQMETQVRIGKDNILLCAPAEARESEMDTGCIHDVSEPDTQPPEPDRKTKLQQDTEDFELIYERYPKKRGKAKAFEYYRGFVGKGRMLGGIRYKLDRREIYLAVDAYVREKEEAGTDLQFYQDFSTFMNKTILDYLPKKEDKT